MLSLGDKGVTGGFVSTTLLSKVCGIEELLALLQEKIHIVQKIISNRDDVAFKQRYLFRLEYITTQIIVREINQR
jgi:hypothetical protein